MSAGGFAASGLLQGFAQSYTAARVRAAEMEANQRHGLASTLMQLYPNARPEAQMDIAQRLLTIYSTPPNKKLDKGLSDISTLGRAATQQNMGAQAGANAPSGAMPQAGGPPPMPDTSGGPAAGAGAPPQIGGPMAAPPISQPIPKPPDLSQLSAQYSPLMSHEERNREAAASIAAQEDAKLSAGIAARDRYLQAHPDADPAEISMALGHTLPMWALHAQVTTKGVLGSELLKSNPAIRTQSGQPVDPNAHYDIGMLGGNQFALPTGIATEAAQSAITGRKNALDEKVNEFKSTDQYRRWKAQMDNDTRERIANMRLQATTNKAPAAMMQTAVFAKGGLERIADAEAEMAKLEASGIMGSLPANKVEDWIFGKGLVDPSLPPDVRQSIGKMRAALGYTSSAAMRAHTGRTSREIYDDFKTRLGAGQDWSALRGAIDETRGMLSDYATSASDENIKAIRSGTNIPAPPSKGGSKATGPKKGDTRSYQGHPYTFDGTQWVAQ